MLGFIAKGFGGLVRETYNVCESAVEEVIDMPSKFIEGIEEGIFTAEEPKVEVDSKEPKVHTVEPKAA